MLFSEWFIIFHKVYCSEILSYDCCREYEIINQKYLYPIHDLKLTDIKPLHIHQCVNTAKDYSNSRIRKVYFLIHRIFNEAVVNDYCSDNPVKKCRPPKKQKKSMKYFSTEQLQMFLDSDTFIARMLHLELLTGLRRGELLALSWENIFIEKSFINVCQTIVNAKGGCILKHTTKSNAERIVTLNSVALDILNQIYEKDSKTGFLFTNQVGDFLSLRAYHDRYKKHFQVQKEKYSQLEYLTGHKLRHTFATFLLQCGSDIETVRTLLGHSNISTTQLYVHTNFNQMKMATSNLKF